MLRAQNKKPTVIPTSFLVSLKAGGDILLPTGHFCNGVCIQKVAKINLERMSFTARISSACISRWLSLFSAAGVIQCRVSTASLWNELKEPGRRRGGNVKVLRLLQPHTNACAAAVRLKMISKQLTYLRFYVKGYHEMCRCSPPCVSHGGGL